MTPPGLSKLVDDNTSAANDPVDATVALVDGKPKVIPARPGVTYDIADVADVFLDLVAAPAGQRTAEVEATVDQAELTTKDARALKIREEISSFTTYFPYAEYRNINIGRAAELINGTVLEPGEEFSLNGIVGERTAENGFVPGFIISNGIFKEDYGGGVSQIATTTFNAMFFAGLKDVEHKPHSFYIDRYPVGREATVAWGAVDLRFENDTPYGVLVDARVTPARHPPREWSLCGCSPRSTGTSPRRSRSATPTSGPRPGPLIHRTATRTPATRVSRSTSGGTSDSPVSQSWIMRRSSTRPTRRPTL